MKLLLALTGLLLTTQVLGDNPVCPDGISGAYKLNLESFEDFLPTSVSMRVTHPGGSSYFDTEITASVGNSINGPLYTGWCIEDDKFITPGTVYAMTKVYSSYDDDLDQNPDLAFTALVEQPLRLDELNYLLNKKWVGKTISTSCPITITSVDVQNVIWKLIEGNSPVVTLTPCQQWLFDDALAEGADYVPPCGGVIAVILPLNPFSYPSPLPDKQTTIIEYTLQPGADYCPWVCNRPYGCNNGNEPVLTMVPNVSYTKLDVDYSEAKLALNGATEPVYPNAWMDFTFNSLDMPPLASITFEAILYDDDLCQGNIIGKTANAHLSSDYTGSPPAKTVNTFITLVIDSTATAPNPGTFATPRLNIFAHPKTFKPAYYNQASACSNDLGETNPPPDYNNPTDSQCGLFEGCVEFQVLHCGDKADFVDVQMEVEFDLLENCEDDFCGELRFVRGPQLKDGEDTEIGRLSCFPCARTGPENPVVVNQGQAVNLCLDIDPDVTGVCIVDIKTLKLDVAVKTGLVWSYNIIPQPGLTLITTSGTNNPNYNPPVIAGKIDGNDATVNVLMPGEPFQELYPKPVNGICPPNEVCEINALITGQALIGLGCICDNTCSRRRLQQNDLYVVQITEEPFTMTVGEEEKVGCTGFFLFCWIAAFLDWLMSLLTFGLL